MELETNFVKLFFVQNEELKNPDYNLPLIQELEEKKLTTVDDAPTPDNPPWGILAAIGVWAASVVFILIFPNVFVIPYLLSQKVDISDAASLTEFAITDPTAVMLQLLAIIPAHILTLVLAWMVVTNLRKYSFRKTLGWNWGGFKFWHGLLIILFFFALIPVLTLVFGEQDNDFMKILQSSRTAVYLVAFFATFTAPMVEEVVYRGVLYSALQRRLGVIWGVVAVTFLFALIHVPQYSKNWIPDFASVSAILFLSLALTLVRVKTGNLLPCIVLHTIFNGIQSVLLILQPYLEQYYKQIENQAPSIVFWLK